jgi:hypothetical protein
VFVRPDGRLSVPLVGEIAAAGKMVRQLQDDLSAVYGNMVKGPWVTVIVKEIKSHPVYPRNRKDVVRLQPDIGVLVRRPHDPAKIDADLLLLFRASP